MVPGGWLPRPSTLAPESPVLQLPAWGAWAYADVLAAPAGQMSHGMTAAPAPRIALATALLAGALYGGWASGQWPWQGPTPAATMRCFAGGMLRGTGSVLVPGGNDSLILLGLPLLWPHAWAAFAVMCTCIGTVLAVRARWRPQPAGSTQS